MLYGLIALGLLSLVQIVMLSRLSVRHESIERVNDRLSHFVEALALLTDTTEAGLATVSTALEEIGRRPATRASRRATSKRIVGDFKRARAVEEIAAAESLSESEVRLHVGLASGSPEFNDSSQGKREGQRG